MKQVSIGELADLTGKSWRTVKARLVALAVPSLGRQANRTLFDSAAALEAIYQVDHVEPGELDLEQERARLARAQFEKVAMENAVRRKELIDINIAGQEWMAFCTAARARLLRAPSDAAAAVPVQFRTIVEAAVRGSVHGALAELANYAPGDDD